EEVELLVPPHHGLRHFSHTSTVEDAMTRDVATVAPGTPLAEVVHLMRDRAHRFAPVIDGERLVGVISNGDLVGRGGLGLRLELHGSVSEPPQGSSERTASDVMSSAVVTTSPEATLHEVGRLMLEKTLKRLPVVAEGKLVGIISRVDLLRSVADVHVTEGEASVPHGARTVSDIARPEVPVVQRETPVTEVLDALVSTRLNRVLVVDGDRQVLGIISDTELLKRIEGDDMSLLDRLMRRKPAGPGSHHQKTAEELMVAPVVTVPTTLPIAEAVRVMLSEQRKLLPVVDEKGRLCGMVDRADALSALFPEDG
ncbi:MAG: CBS domain-containing protein, partial [Candidatus Dormibacteria bacterium]